MRWFKSAIIFLSFIGYILCALTLHLILIIAAPKNKWAVMNRFTRRFIGWLAFVVGLRIKVLGHKEYLKEQGNFVICRHIGYIDGLVVGSLFPGTFVSKNEIKKWPLIGKVIQASGTIFVNRQQKTEVTNSIEKIIERLNRNINILIFPEGTSTDGTKILPFQSPFFNPPILSKKSIVPVTIDYLKIDGKPITDRDDVCWYPPMPFHEHLWKLLSFKSIDVTVTIHKKIKTLSYQPNSIDRKELATKCRQTLLDLENKKDPLPLRILENV